MKDIIPRTLDTGKKYSNNKPNISVLFKQFPDALKAITLASMFGHIKYEEFDHDYLNYKRVEGEDNYLDAGLRHHLLKCPSEEESGLPPKFHIAWNAIADLQLFIEKHDINLEELSKLNIPIWKTQYCVS